MDADGSGVQWDASRDLARAREAAQGDEAALAALIAELKPLTWRRAWSIARPDRHQAEDLAQEGIFRALRPATLNAYLGHAPLLAYLGIVAQRRMVGLVRSGRERAWAARTEIAVDSSGGADPRADPTSDVALRRHDAARLEALVAALEPELGLLVRLKASGVPNPEIGELLELPVGTVKSRFARACHRLRAEMEGAGV